ncbi:MAG: beta-ketoacyl-ACP synthase II [Dehalococcoidia bacterium]|nr:beta-ketoacyl-ACP synthase II [Dehalococcoidia bacterium]
MASSRRRVVITGMGAVSPIGETIPDIWQALLEGRSGIAPITLFDASRHETKISAEVKNWDPIKYLDRKEARRMDRFAQFAVAASLLAKTDAGIESFNGTADSTGVIMGNCIGGLTTVTEQFKVLNEKGPDRVSPFLAPMMSSDSGAGQVSIVLGVKGPNFCASSACSSGADAVGEAAEIIRRGDAVAMVAGGAEACILPISFAGFNAAKALSTHNGEPQKASRPFDALRDGFIIGEGGAALILEELDHARRRGARIYAELVGYGATADAYHITQPAENGDGAVRAMRKALANSGLQTSDIDYINAHGTSTPIGDRVETVAIKTVFGDHARRLAISSTKSVMGHLLGAAGAIEAIVCVLAITKGLIPPTINLANPDPACDLDYVPCHPRKADVRVALSNSFGFGGHNSTLVFKRMAE